MEEQQSLNDNMNDIEQKISNNQWPKSAKLTFIIFSFILISVVIIFIVILVQNSKETENENVTPEKKEEKKEDKKEDKKPSIDYNQFFNTFPGKIIRNISYANDYIENTFAEGKIHYNQYIGNVHEGKDYKANDKNQYDLFVPYSVTKTKKVRGIILWIHGGAWVKGQRSEGEVTSTIYFRAGYVAATMDYSLLEEGNKDITMYRMVDEIYTCVRHIKDKLVYDFGVNEDDLELGIGGGSAGGHLALLYGYMIKDSPIPVKFILDVVGPVMLIPHNYIMIKKDQEPFDDLDSIDIETINRNEYPLPVIDQGTFINILYHALGKTKTKSEIDKMLIDGRADLNNEEYKLLLEEVKYLSPVYYISDECPPTYCFYAGKDEYVGFLQYPLFKETAIKFEKFFKNVQLIYSKYTTHSFIELEPSRDFYSNKELNFYFFEAARNHFSNDK